MTLVGVICRCEALTKLPTSPQPERIGLPSFSNCPTASLPTTPLRASSRASTPKPSRAAFLLGPSHCPKRAKEGSLRSTEKPCATHFKAPMHTIPIHMVSAWVCDNHMVLGQMKVGDKTNEIKAVPLLLELLDLEGAIVTADAMSTQKAIAHQIVDKANYVLPLKYNQPNCTRGRRGLSGTRPPRTIPRCSGQHNPAHNRPNQRQRPWAPGDTDMLGSGMSRLGRRISGVERAMLHRLHRIRKGK